jgi:hypothetical protein
MLSSLSDVRSVEIPAPSPTGFEGAVFMIMTVHQTLGLTFNINPRALVHQTLKNIGQVMLPKVARTATRTVTT